MIEGTRITDKQNEDVSTLIHEQPFNLSNVIKDSKVHSEIIKGSEVQFNIKNKLSKKDGKYTNVLTRHPEDRNVDDKDVNDKRKHVKSMMKDAWDVYVAYAWGYDEVKPNSKSIHDRHGSRIPMGTSIVDSMSTLYIMGLDEEFEKGRKWIEESFDFNRVQVDVSVFETNIRFVGG